MNLTGYQIQVILDSLVIDCISPIIMNSDLFDRQIAYILVLITRNKKRKISVLDREVLKGMSLEYLETKDPLVKIEILKSMKLERGLLYGFAENIVDILQVVPKIAEEIVLGKKLAHLKLKAIYNTTNISPDKQLSTYYSCKDNLSIMYEFRNSILLKYKNYAIKNATVHCLDKPNMDSKEMASNFMIAVVKALDKYDSSKGALTSYIQWWMVNARNVPTHHSHEYGTAYTVPYSKKKSIALKTSNDVNLGFDIELATCTVNNNNTIEEEEDEKILSILAKIADPEGYGRLFLGIPDVLTLKELENKEAVI